MNRRGIAALAVLAALAICALWLVRPAGATPSATRTATLSVTGVVVNNCPVSTGGSVIYIKPGDTVDFTTTLAGINISVIQIPGLLGSQTLTSNMIGSFNSTLALTDEKTSSGTQVVRSLTTKNDYRRTFARQGTYTFGWTATSLSLLPPLNLTVPLSAKSGLVSAGAALSWKGQVVVSPQAGPCGLSAQLPGVSASASVTGVGQLPTIGVPGINLPTATLPANIPTISLPGGQPGGSASKPGQKTSTQSGYHVDYTPHGPGVAATTVPTGYGAGNGQNGSGGTGLGPQVNASPGAKYGSAAPAANIVGNRKAVELARPDATGQGTRLPVLWIIAAVAALSTATVAYARQFLAGGRG